MSDDFAPDWLALREPYDRAARSRAMALKFFDALPDQSRLVDLGTGTGSNARFLSMATDKSIAWRLIDRDQGLLDRISGIDGERTRIDFAPSPMRIDLLDCDGVTASAFFDLVSENWFSRFVKHMSSKPLLLSLTVDGQFHWQPEDDMDELMMGRFAAAMQRDKGFGPAMGFDAPRLMINYLWRAGYRVTSALTSWQLEPGDTDMLKAVCGFVGDVAGNGLAADAWRLRRELLIKEKQLSLSVGHVDILALP